MDTFCGRFLSFDYALATGQAQFYEQAVRMLARATEMCARRNFATLWWICFIARHLIGDLWDQSLHVRLPRGGDMPDGERFEGKRPMNGAEKVG
jgi:hypothetical protein